MPLLFKKQVSQSTRIAVWAIHEEEEKLLQLLPPLKTAEKELLKKISFKPRRLEWLASRVLIYQMTGVYPETGYFENGQPFIVRHREHVSISHTKGYAAVSVSCDSTPGIDIEFPSPRITKVAGRFLNQKKETFLRPELKEKQLGLIWCAKEAIFKKAGQPGLIFKDQIITTPFFPENDEGSFEAKLYLKEVEYDIKLKYYCTDDFYLVWLL
ncbi:4'-phosphopantetheinyl transferase family protein [Marinilabilia rubra]|uniref:4-phosphopantetheinyl transferase n=1 Tax=Marinilabilia rubra TaxID=2162893 RepID=A0A2U2BDX5_9BACT|nr:4'-phosphopantetheinyl transferase superfamily protein [Marinilabilia rubra]PWE01272.1 4-phosphopantetheinyl transferase [Marinilabilia rubra]